MKNRKEFQSRIGLRRHQRKLNEQKRNEIKIKNEEWEMLEENPIKKWFSNFCNHTTIHDITYLGQSNLHWSESPLSTVVESTIFPVSEISFPAITICNTNRFHKERFLKAKDIFLPDADRETREEFQLFLTNLNNSQFGAFDEFDEKAFNLTPTMELKLNSLNLTEVFKFVMLSCEEIIFNDKCWWRNKYFNCCDNLIYLQRSGYGLCYSFNNAVSNIGLRRKVEKLF
ncbi:CLUMA_CG001003, isoform A [Clunio marinus]|uniref:CLUMA_CG001003, isoform A n=1 Tax=Clunio marinus TaxID=568069 RepID=A0A1J1HL65_9DIPT|nr:CLUMA_CG001003, isoform A [Clunio marinus]